MAKDALIKTAETLFALIPPGKEPVAEALVSLSSMTFGQRHYLWKVIKKYEFSLQMIGVKMPPEPMAPITLPSEPHFVDFINGKYILRLSEDHAEHIHMVPKAKFDRKSGLYSVPQRMYPVMQLHKFVKQVNLYYTEAAKEAILWMYAEMRERFKASSAQDADIDMGDFGLALDPYQKAGIKAAARCQRAWIADGMGLGKTRQALGVLWVCQNLKQITAFPALVICPASVPINWQKEAQQAFPNKRIFRLEKKTLPKHSCKQKQLSLLDMDRFDDTCKACLFHQADIVIVNYDKLPNGWKAGFETDPATGKRKKIKGYKREKGERADVELSEVGGALKARSFRSVVIDESHYIKEETSQRTKAVHEVATGSTIRLALSGTPIKNRPKELISQAKFLDRLDDLGGHDVFCRKFCAADLRDGKFDDTGSSNENELHKMLRGVGFIQRNKRDVKKDLPPIREAEIWVDIDNWDEYKRVEKDVVNWCAEQAVLKEEFIKYLKTINPSAHDAVIERKMIETRIRIMRVQALIKVGALKKVAAFGKLSAIKSWITDFKETGLPLVIFAHHREIQYQLADMLNCLHIFGKDNVLSRQKHKEIYMGERPNDTGLSELEIVCSFGAAREGVNLDKGDDILLCEQQWTPTDEDQAIARVDRHRVHNITVYRILAQGTIEEKIQMKLAGKRRIVDAVTKGERGAATSQELDIFDEVFGELAAMSTDTVDRDAIKRTIREQVLAVSNAESVCDTNLSEEVQRLEAALVEAV